MTGVPAAEHDLSDDSRSSEDGRSSDSDTSYHSCDQRQERDALTSGKLSDRSDTVLSTRRPSTGVTQGALSRVVHTIFVLRATTAPRQDPRTTCRPRSLVSRVQTRAL